MEPEELDDDGSEKSEEQVMQEYKELLASGNFFQCFNVRNFIRDS